MARRDARTRLVLQDLFRFETIGDASFLFAPHDASRSVLFCEALQFRVQWIAN
jgi:hypothetical protein